jgi:general stress protein YciG
METDEKDLAPGATETVPEYLSRIGAAGGRVGGRATGPKKVRGDSDHYQHLGRRGGAVQRRRTNLRVRMGLLQVISAAEARLADGDLEENGQIDPADRANMELALKWLRDQAKDRPRPRAG